MNILQFRICPALVLFTLGCSHVADQPPAVRSQEYQIYKVLIDSLWSAPKSLRDRLHVAEFHLIINKTVPLTSIQDDSYLPHDAHRRPLYTYPNRDTFPTQESWVKGLNQFYNDAGARPKTLYAYYRRLYPEQDWQLIQNEFEALNRQTSTLDSSSFIFDIPHYLISPNMIRQIDSAQIVPGPNLPRSRSTGYTEFSRAAFNTEQNLAIVYYVNGIPGGGEYGFALLVRKHDRWSIQLLLTESWL